MWKKIKKWLLSRVEKVLLREIDKLDKYEAILVDIMREKIDSDEKAEKLLKKAEVELLKLVNKAFAWKFLSVAFFGGVKKSLVKEIKRLKDYQDEVALIIEQGLDTAEGKAIVLVDMAQDYLRAMVKKYMKKI